MVSDDTEITLGAGKLLGLFFLLAAICAVFFSIGYSLGRSNGREQALNDQVANPPAVTEQAGGAPPPAGASQGKPSAAVAVRSSDDKPASSTDQSSDQTGNLTFYKAVKQNDPDSQLTAKATPPVAPAKVTKAGEMPSADVSRNAAVPETPAGGHTPEASRSAPVTGPGTIVVQIAAVSREDDAVALAGALRKKNYDVFVVNNPATHDKFYHVQVGPFSSMQDAEATKAKLVGEGYSPIVKR